MHIMRREKLDPVRIVIEIKVEREEEESVI